MIVQSQVAAAVQNPLGCSGRGSTGTRGAGVTSVASVPRVASEVAMSDAATTLINQIQETLRRHNEAFATLAVLNEDLEKSTVEHIARVECSVSKILGVLELMANELTLCKRALETVDKRVDALERKVADFDAHTAKALSGVLE